MAVTTITIKSDGKVVDQGLEILSIEVNKELNKIPLAELRLIDGNVAKKEFKVLDSGVFDIGKSIEILLRHEGNPGEEAAVFKGIVVNIELAMTSGRTALTVEMSDEAIRMTNGRHNAIYHKSDAEIIKDLALRNKLKADRIAKTTVKHKEMVQFYASDWDFALSRAEANGHMLIADDGVISTLKPEVNTPALSLELGQDTIYDFDLQVNGRQQCFQVDSIGWDIAKQSLSKPASGSVYQFAQGNQDLAKFTDVVGGKSVTLMHPVPLPPQELRTWADAQVIKSRLALIRGWVCITGTNKVKPGQTLEIKGMSKSFTGSNIVSGVRQEVNHGSWNTYVQIGMDIDWFATKANIMDTPAAGLLPGVNGLQIGQVTAYEKDPENHSRVKVHIPAFNKEKETVWARLTSLYAGAERGMFFRPEIGDEVIVGFLNDDPRQAIILGAVHSSAKKTPLDVTSENAQKGIITKQKYQLLFDEEKETITLSTSPANSICIDEKNKLINIKDINGNQVELSSNGVKIDSAKNFKITAKKNIEMEAKGNVSIKGAKIDLI
ncbi:type VI secretion system tip protein VgrG [Fulvivirga maritima]|uniref:type VI secretion system tip protein VgrG n=1 Tax=Fulvivirga maritima TaxID=2904247 RepID=UPI001F23CDA2|nr:type VI secretion system tip protein VgrG [Fulvivirga maritima]UII24676.1 type VI secretion system tip protein VgrG [Fulvivirga maritima]